MTSRLLSLACLLAAGALAAGEAPVAAVRAGLPFGAGLVVQAGAEDGSLAEGLAKAGGFVVTALSSDPDTVDRLRLRLRDAGVHGQATVVRMAGNRLPFTDGLADVVVADPKGSVPATELERVVRPGGTILRPDGGAWKPTVRARPTDIDSWPMYHRDAAGTNHSRDMQVGPGLGLRWVAGPQYGSDGALIVDEFALFCHGWSENRQGRSLTVMRNAFNGLTLWSRGDIGGASPYGIALSRTRTYLLPSTIDGAPANAWIAVDTASGKTLQVLDQGVTFPPVAGNDKEARRFDDERRKHAMAVLSDDGTHLLQVAGGQAALLDAATGKRRWAVDAAAGGMFLWPIIAGDTAVLCEGPKTESLNYTFWPMISVKRVRAVGLADGRERWSYAWPEGRTSGALHNLFAIKDRIVLNVRTPAERLPGGGLSGPARPQGMLILQAASGKETYWASATPFLDARVGGHSGHRILPVGDRLWNTTLGEVLGSVALAAPDSEVTGRYAHGRPAGCTSFRSTPRFILGSLAAYPLIPSAEKDAPILYAGAARNGCDIGAMPANGLLYMSPNHCFCGPYLPGSTAFHAQKPGPADDSERLERGPAKAAPAVEGPGWPMIQRDGARTNWTDEALPAQLAPLWTAKPAGEAPSGEIGNAWSHHFHAQGQVTGVSVAEGIAVVAASHRQLVIGLDPATGTERWRAPVDGRVDSQPTIHRGLVLAGTCNGYVYALNRDTGALVWRFRAAPRHERILVDGAVESPWPVHGSILVDGDRAFVIAGRHSEADGGLRMYILDAATGAQRGSGRIGQDDPLPTANMYTEGWSARGRHPAAASLPRPVGNNIPVLSGGLLFLPGTMLKPEGNALVSGTLPTSAKGNKALFVNAWNFRNLIPGNQGVLSRMRLSGFMLSAYNGVTAQIFATKGDDFVAVGSSRTTNNRGGDGGDAVWRHVRLDAMEQVMGKDGKPIDAQRYAKDVWEGQGTPRDVTAMAVVGDAVLVAGRTPAALDVLDYATGARRQRIELPAPTVRHAIASDDGRVFVGLTDGTVMAFGKR